MYSQVRRVQVTSQYGLTDRRMKLLENYLIYLIINIGSVRINKTGINALTFICDLYSFVINNLLKKRLCNIASDKMGYSYKNFFIISPQTYVFGTRWKDLIETLFVSTITYVFVEKFVSTFLLKKCALSGAMI